MSREKFEGMLSVVQTVVATVAVVALARTFVVQSYKVPTGSMETTICVGDRLLGERVSQHWEAPKQGDVIFFADPDGGKYPLVKRVIATEGQTVEFEGGMVVIDGVALDEPYTHGKPSYPLDVHSDPALNITYPYIVPEGCVWVMGDNRTGSSDSRVFGAIDVRSIESKALCIYWPPSHAAKM